MTEHEYTKIMAYGPEVWPKCLESRAVALIFSGGEVVEEGDPKGENPQPRHEPATPAAP